MKYKIDKDDILHLLGNSGAINSVRRHFRKKPDKVNFVPLLYDC